MDSGMVAVKMSSDQQAQAQRLCFKALSFSGKRERSRNEHQAHETPSYKECQKNHAAAIGGHALDGCGEYMPPPSPSLQCAACGCHRNFHRPETPSAAAGVESRMKTVAAAPIFSHRPRRFSSTSPSSSSSPSRSEAPISSIYPSAPQILMTLSSGVEMTSAHTTTTTTAPDTIKLCFGEDGKMGKPRKRFRTKFSAEQKEKMRMFAEGFGWKMQRSDEDVVKRFCDEIGVCRSVLKVWMHNNKSRNSTGINSNNTFDYNGGGLNGDRVDSEEMHLAGINGGKQSTHGGSSSSV
uniref:ZF-HD dimerization-type domain-containing protein n=1 Tax=Kalanchoe fedtschenkoi TaxID=63787 RepID=A0A7N0V4J2_KALFE